MSRIEWEEDVKKRWILFDENVLSLEKRALERKEFLFSKKIELLKIKDYDSSLLSNLE